MKSTTCFYHGRIPALQKAIEEAGRILIEVYEDSIHGRINDSSAEFKSILETLRAEADLSRRLPKGAVPIPGFPDYCIKEDGSVFTRNVFGSQGKKIGPWWKMKPIESRGYLQLTLHNEKKGGKVFRLHRLVMLVFKRKSLLNLVRHLDGNPKNNHISNLAYGNHKDNAQDAQRHGTIARGERIGSSKLKEHQVREVLKRYANGERQISICRLMGLDPNTVSGIVRKKTWRHVTV